MDADKPKRPWYRRKRAWAALVLWLVVAYPLSRGPAEYASVRGWLPPSYAQAFFGPLESFLPQYQPPITNRRADLFGDGHVIIVRSMRLSDPRTW